MPGSEMQNSMFKKTRGYVQKNNPFAVTSCGRRRNDGESIYESDSPLEKRLRKTTKGKGRNFRTTKEGAGMTSKGVKAYRRKNPGSKLKTAKRRKSFCARSKGWTGERGKAARRRWKC